MCIKLSLDWIWGKVAYERDTLALARDVATLAQLMDAEDRNMTLGLELSCAQNPSIAIQITSSSKFSMVGVSHLHGLCYVRRSRQSLKITHMKNQNVVGASIVQSFMTKNHGFLSATQTNALDKAFSAKRLKGVVLYINTPRATLNLTLIQF